MRTRSFACINSLTTPLPAFSLITSITIANNSGYSILPRCTSTFTSYSSEFTDPTFTLVFALSYNLITTRIITSDESFFFKALSITFHRTLSTAFSSSTTHIQLLVIVLIFLHCSSHKNIASTVPFPAINPNCILFKLTSVCIYLFSTHSKIFMACFSTLSSLCDPQLITLAFHSSGIPPPSNIC